MFLLTMNNNSQNKDLTHLTTKMVTVNNLIENNLSNIAAVSKHMNLDTLYIFSIIIDDTFEYEMLELEAPSKIKYVEIGVKFFIENFLENPNNDFWKHNKNSLYILRGGNYSDIKEIFTIIQNTKVQLVRGSSQKSHIVSPIDFRLSCYLMILCNMNYKKFYTENSFNIITKDRYLPSSK